MSRSEIFKSLIGKKIRVILKNNESVDGILREVNEQQLTFDKSKSVQLDQIENYFLIDGNGKDVDQRK